MNSKILLVTKLNGSAGFYTENEWWKVLREPVGPTGFYESLGYFNVLLEVYIKNIHYSNWEPETRPYAPLLSFAWEENVTGNDVIEIAVARTRKTQVLVVVGYSFPYFNREIDSKILENMTNLGKIYIQDPNAEDIEQRLTTLFRRDRLPPIICLNKTSQFLFPNEL